MIKIIRSVFVFLIFTLLAKSHAVEFRECGIFEAEGVLRMLKDKSKTELILILNEKAESETHVRLGSYSEKDPDALHLLRAKVRFRVLQKCSLKCEASLEELLVRIEEGRNLEEFNELKARKLKSTSCLTIKELQKPRAVKRIENVY